MVHLAEIDPAAGALGGVLGGCVIFVGSISMVLHFVLRRFQLVVALCTTGFTVFLLAVGAYFEFVRHEHTDLGDFVKLAALGAAASLVVSSAAGVPLLLARRSEEKRRRRHASGAS